jgi:(1->4)-alpha-D-glucan 1-alpha-D-glucosylmutase
MTGNPYAIPRATYRLQLNKDFDFIRAAKLAPYLAKLGISHAYLSPITKARSGSRHGYDVVDHQVINPELGGLDGFRALAMAMRDRGIRILLDVVPNHMAIGGAENTRWLDLLEWGRHSRHAHWFDVNWSPPDSTLEGRVLVPLLGSSYDQAIRGGQLHLKFEKDTGAFTVWADGVHKLPLTPKSYAGVLAAVGGELGQVRGAFASLAPGAYEPAETLKGRLAAICAYRGDLARAVMDAVAGLNADHAALDALIGQQHWRPAHFSAAASQINYRRFFTVNDLARIRVEDEDVFDHVHERIFQLVDEGLVHGLRIDHVDGLFDPKAYCAAVRRKCPRPIYLIVEKILAPHERLPEAWQVDGTTGYEFGARVGGMLSDPESEPQLSAAYSAFTGDDRRFATIERESKLAIIDGEMTAELENLTTQLSDLAAAGGRGLAREGLRGALRLFVASMAVYRTYVDEAGPSDSDRCNIAHAVARAKRTAPPLRSELDFLEEVMLLNVPQREAALEAVRSIQQYTGPVMAKGLEDTALYRYNRLIAHNEVGARPDRFTVGAAAFHDANRRQRANFPAGLLATSTHDTKRGEDTRARILALSGCVPVWTKLVPQWVRLLEDAGAPRLDASDIWLFFQLLLGAWPAEFPNSGELDRSAVAAFRSRMDEVMLKSVREARTRSSWGAPALDYEKRVLLYVHTALSPDPGNQFLASFREFERTIRVLGALNSAIMTTLKLTAPGVPDIYQGAELWEQSMVDPDNRRTVDFARRNSLLTSNLTAEPLPHPSGWDGGTGKLALTAKLLGIRAADPDLFTRGSYEPLPVDGADGQRVCSFIRRHEHRALLVAASVWPWRGPAHDCTVLLPRGIHELRWRNVLSGEEISVPKSLRGKDLFAEVPVCVLLLTEKARA